MSSMSRQSQRTLEMCIFALLGALMFGSKKLMEALPNIHLLGLLTMVSTVVFREKALVPIYLYVILEGLFAGFNLWWFPYLYIWTILWGVTMLLPKNMPKKVATVVYPAVCGLHGFLYGILYAPAQAIIFGLDWNGMVGWIVTGIPYDLIHGLSNVMAGLLVLPLAELIRQQLKRGR